MESENESGESLPIGSKTSLDNHENDAKGLEATNDIDTQDEDEDDQETLIERLQLLRPKNPYLSLDKRAHTIRETIKQKFKHAPKSSHDEAEEDKSLLERRLNESDRLMEDLISFGNEIITNIEVASEKRELLRREFEACQRLDLENHISEETTELMANYDEIVSRWSELGELQEPMTLFQKLEGQKNSISALMSGKDEMIEKCQEEIDRMNERFEEDLYNQQTDICSMVERANGQLNLLKQAYSHHMSLLEDTIESERQTIALKEQEKWKNFYDVMQKSEEHKLSLVQEKKLFYNSEIRRITKHQEELTRATRIRLEKEADEVLHELRCTGNRVLMNSEKLDYNYQVLQKRNEENVIINNQQKRRVGKMNETIGQLRKQIQASHSIAEQMFTKLSNEIQKLHDSISDLERKSERCHLNNRKKFFAIWDNNFQEVKTHIEKIYDIDRMLHEQLLGVPWEKPQLDLEDFYLVKMEKSSQMSVGDATATAAADAPSTSSNSSNIFKHKKTIAKSASGEIKQQTFKFRGRQRETLIRKAEEERRVQEQRIENRLLRNILRKVASRGKFLVEDRLNEFLTPYNDECKRLVCIDNIFAALHITDVAAVKRLVDFFRPYAWCPNCMKGVPQNQLKKLYRSCKLSGFSCVAAGDDDSFDDRGDPSANDDDDDDESVSTTKAISLGTIKFSAYDGGAIDSTLPPEGSDQTVKCENHNLVVESALVLTALSEFSNQEAKSFEEESKRHRVLRPSRTIASTTPDKSKTSSATIEVSNDTICRYWRKFHDYMPEEKLKLWHTLEHGMHHYLDVLKQREQLDKECAALRRQNAELKHLLQKFDV